MKVRMAQVFAAGGVFGLGLLWALGIAEATLSISSVVGGAPTGVGYVNFTALPLGSTGGISGDINVSFTGDAQAVQGAAAGLYAPPFLSNSNGVLFGDPTIAGPDTTTYLTTGLATVTLTFPVPEQYFGLLWGSVDSYNSLSFFDATNQVVGAITGLDVTAVANGNQGASGTFYVNINSTLAFTKVVATSSIHSFEFDNVAFNPTPVTIPEPAACTLFSVGLLGLACMRRKLCRSRTRAM